MHLEGYQSVLIQHGHEKQVAERSSSKLLLYFKRPNTAEFDNLTSLDFYEQYIVDSSVSKQPKGVVCFYLPDGVHYVHKRQRGKGVARLYCVAPNR